jgi:hypothetical protein
MQEKESLIESDYRLLRGAVIYSLLPFWIKWAIHFLIMFVGFFGLIALMRSGTLVGEFGCIVGGLIASIVDLFKMIIIDLPVYAFTGNSHSYSSVSNVCDKHSLIPYVICSGIIIFIGLLIIKTFLLFSRYALLTSAQKKSVRQHF